MVQMYVAEASTSERVRVTRRFAASTATTATVFLSAESSRESEGHRLTREILSDPDALAEIVAAREAIARGDAVRGIAAVRALRPRQ